MRPYQTKINVGSMIRWALPGINNLKRGRGLTLLLDSQISFVKLDKGTQSTFTISG